jgi:uncharacterized protein YegP (UPF0339 family)
MGDNARRWEIRTSKDGEKYFVGIAGNGEIVCTGQMYKGDGAEASARKGIESTIELISAPILVIEATKPV